MKKIPYIDYKAIPEFCTINEVCRLFEVSKRELQELCETYDVQPRRNEIGEYGPQASQPGLSQQPGGPEGGSLGMTELLTVKETAAYLRTSLQQVRRMIREGDLFAVKVGREYRIPLSALAEFLEER